MIKAKKQTNKKKKKKKKQQIDSIDLSRHKLHFETLIVNTFTLEGVVTIFIWL